MTLSAPQAEALALLVKRQCYTARWTYGDMTISGAVASTLVKKGLARYVRGWQVGVPGDTVVQITNAGMAAYAAYPGTVSP